MKIKNFSKISGGTTGSVIAIVVIVILIVLGAIYFWSGKSTSEKIGGSQIVPVASVSKSDDINSIENDLKITDPGPDVSGLN